MADKKPLRILTAFGASRANTLLLAVHPDEEHDRFGKPLPNRRTFVLQLRGSQAVFVEERPVPLARAWYSSGSGVAYCTSVATNKIYLWRSGAWSEEEFAPAPVRFVPFIFGFPGERSTLDQVFMVSEGELHIRTQGRWTQSKLRGVKFPYQIHGRSPTELFIGGDKLMKWDGQRAQEVAQPDHDTVSRLCVTSDDRIVGGNTYMSITDASGGWQRIDMPMKNFGTLMEFQSVIYAGSMGAGVARVWPGPGVATSPPCVVDRLASVGDALVTTGRGPTMVGDGVHWDVVQVPECEVGKTP